MIAQDEAVFRMARLSLCKIRLHHAVTDGGNEPAIFLQALSQSWIGTVFAGSQQTRSCSPSEEVDFPESDLESTKVCCWLGDAHWYEVAWNANGLVAKAVVAARSSNQTVQVTSSGCRGSNRNAECHRLNEHVRFSRRCTLHCGCSLLL